MMADDPERDDENEVLQARIAYVLRELPLCDEPYLGMQTLNLDVVDAFLEEQEGRMLSEYMEEERTPLPTAVFVSALSQMWVFALYEFLRTWRQRARNVLQWAEEIQALPVKDRPARLAAKKAEIESKAAEPEGAAVFYWPAYEDAVTDQRFVESLRKAIDVTERLFRRIEALRMSLAKHEMPRVKGSYAMAPGYGRIDMLTGSINWLVALRDDEVDLVSRRSLADDCRRLTLNREVLILSEAVQDKMKKLPEHSYGVKRIVAVLDDGIEYRGVYVGWGKEVLSVEGQDAVPFDVDRVVEVRSDPLPPAQTAPA
jgi:hypothetical protein